MRDTRFYVVRHYDLHPYDKVLIGTISLLFHCIYNVLVGNRCNARESFT
jgi:hypothetical protein